MIGDKLDFFIIRFFLENKHKNITTWDIMKSYLSDSSSINRDRHFREKTHQVIKKRIGCMINDGIFFKKLNGGNRYVYILIKERARICQHRFPDGYKKALILMTPSGWNIFQI